MIMYIWTSDRSFKDKAKVKSKISFPILLLTCNCLDKISAGANQKRTRVNIRKSQTLLCLLAGDPHHFSWPFVARIHLLWKWGNRWIWKGYKTANVDIISSSLTSLRFPADRWERPKGPKYSCWDYTMFTEKQETIHSMKSRFLWKLYLIVNFSSFSASNLTELSLIKLMIWDCSSHLKFWDLIRHESV